MSSERTVEESELFCQWLKSDIEKNQEKISMMALKKEELKLRINKLHGTYMISGDAST